MKRIKPYKKNALRTTDCHGQFIFVPFDEDSVSEMNCLGWREEHREKAKNKVIKRKDAEGKLMDFDPNANARECSFDILLENGGEHWLDCSESFEDSVINKVFTEKRLYILKSIIPSLSDEEKNILGAEMNDISSRKYEKYYGTPRKTYLYRRKKLFSKLRSMIETREKEVGICR